MTIIELHTSIDAPIENVFNLSRSIDFHMESASQTKETAVSGRTSGLIGYGETVTWRGRHFGFFLQHTSKIVDYEYPLRFTDVMIKGHFKYFGHQHFFETQNGETLMTDVLKYKVPYGWLGRIFDYFFLKRHLTEFLMRRNRAIKINLEAFRYSDHIGIEG